MSLKHHISKRKLKEPLGLSIPEHSAFTLKKREEDEKNTEQKRPEIVIDPRTIFHRLS